MLLMLYQVFVSNQLAKKKREKKITTYYNLHVRLISFSFFLFLISFLASLCSSFLPSPSSNFLLYVLFFFTRFFLLLHFSRYPGLYFFALLPASPAIACLCSALIFVQLDASSWFCCALKLHRPCSTCYYPSPLVQPLLDAFVLSASRANTILFPLSG